MSIEQRKVKSTVIMESKVKKRLGEEHCDGWSKSWKNWKVEKEQKLKTIVMNRVKSGKGDKLKNVVMNGVKSGKGDKLKNVVMNGVKTGKVGKLDNCKIDEEMWSRSEERLCKSIIKGRARCKREKHTMLADVGEDQEQSVICFDDITVKELPWHAMHTEWVDTDKAFEEEPINPITNVCERVHK